MLYKTLSVVLMKKLFGILTILFFLSSCDCLQIVSGVVVDNETGKPLQGVVVYDKYEPGNKTTTDSSGYFLLQDIVGGCFRCPPMTVVAGMQRYEQAEVVIPSGSKRTIQLQRKYDHTATLQTLHGRWIHDQDSLATVYADENTWIFMYGNSPTEKDDIFSVTIADRLPEFSTEKQLSGYLILSNSFDTLQYEILTLNDSSLSLMYLPAGKIHVYNKMK